MRSAPMAVITLLGVVALGACDSGSGGHGDRPSSTGRPGTTPTLTVHGVATTAPAPGAPAPRVPFSGTLTCPTGNPSGTGMFAATAVAAERCAQLAAHGRDLLDLGPDRHRVCAEIYGGPQTARITGTVDGRSVHVTVSRSDSCGIDDWNRLTWLLGPPER